MRKIIVLSFITLDGIMQAPGGPEEDTSGGFQYGGWSVPYFDDFAGGEMGRQMAEPMDLLLGRKTYEIFADYWPHHEENWPGVNSMKKYVASKTLKESLWNNTEFLNNPVEQIREIRKTPGANLQVHGSGNFIQTLLKHDLVDELWLKIFPITLGKGKRLFAEGTQAQAFELIESKVSPSGIIFANYKRVGEVQTGSF